MASVPRIFLDAMNVDFPHSDTRFANALAKIRETLQQFVRLGLLVLQILQCLSHLGCIAANIIEIGIGTAVDMWFCLTINDSISPVPFDFCQMPQQSEQRKIRRWNRSHGELLWREIRTFHENGLAIGMQIIAIRFQLAIRAGAIGIAGIIFRIHPHIGIHRRFGPPGRYFWHAGPLSFALTPIMTCEDGDRQHCGSGGQV